MAKKMEPRVRVGWKHINLRKRGTGLHDPHAVGQKRPRQCQRLLRRSRKPSFEFHLPREKDRHALVFDGRRQFIRRCREEGINVLGDADQKRFRGSDDQLKGFFEGTFYKSCAPGVPKPYGRPDRAWRFWTR